MAPNESEVEQPISASESSQKMNDSPPNAPKDLLLVIFIHGYVVVSLDAVLVSIDYYTLYLDSRELIPPSVDFRRDCSTSSLSRYRMFT